MENVVAKLRRRYKVTVGCPRTGTLEYLVTACGEEAAIRQVGNSFMCSQPASAHTYTVEEVE